MVKCVGDYAHDHPSETNCAGDHVRLGDYDFLKPKHRRAATSQREKLPYWRYWLKASSVPSGEVVGG